MKDSTFITRVFLKNYKSIAACDVWLQPLTFLVGRNGSGKSNFLDALRFVADALNSSLDHAIRDRGGGKEIRYRSVRAINHINISLEFTLPENFIGYYAFRINFSSGGRYIVQTEICRVQHIQSSKPEAYFRVDNGKVTNTSAEVAPAASKDRLYLVNASGLPEFRSVYDAFSRMGFYNINPDKIRDLQTPDTGELLTRDGSNLTSVVTQLSPSVKQRVEEYLAMVIPGVHEIKVKRFGPKETLAFRQDVAGAKDPWQFSANNMSDGTLRVLGILIALFQGNSDMQKHLSLVGIEEPELALHPAAAGVLLDSLRDAAEKTQVMITSHSPDLLDNKDLDVDSILAVNIHDRTTAIAGVDNVGRSTLQKRLCTTGELLRNDQLQPDPTSVAAAKTKQFRPPNFKKRNSNGSKITKLWTILILLHMPPLRGLVSL